MSTISIVMSGRRAECVEVVISLFHMLSEDVNVDWIRKVWGKGIV